METNNTPENIDSTLQDVEPQEVTQNEPVVVSQEIQAEIEEVQPVDNKADEPIPKNASPDNPLRILEALLFASDEILTTDKIKAILPGQPDARKIRQMVDAINVQYAKERHPFEIVEIGGGFQFRTVSYYYPWVVQLFKEKTAKKLSIQSLECLAIIAYKQPITKAEIEQIRGVLSDGAMKTLLEKRLVTIAGRSEKAGRPLLYATTKDFLEYFGINKIADLPQIEEFEAMAKERLGELTEQELKTIDEHKADQPETENGEAKSPENAGQEEVVEPVNNVEENTEESQEKPEVREQ
jgi:segregation and condensation protein B